MSLFCADGQCDCWRKSSLPEFLVHFWPKRFDQPFDGGRDTLADAAERTVRKGGETSMWTDRAVGTTAILAGAAIWAAALGSHPLIAYVGNHPTMIRSLVWHLVHQEQFVKAFGAGVKYQQCIDVCGARIGFYPDLRRLRGVSRIMADGTFVRTTLHLIDRHDALFPHYLRNYAGLMVTPRDQPFLSRRVGLV